VNVHSTVTGVEIVQKNVQVAVGETTKLEAVVFPETAYLKDVTWRSSNSGIAMVNSKGEVKGIKEGTSTISAITKDGQKVATTTVKVNSLAEGIHVSTNSIKVYMGDTASFTASIYPDTTLVTTITTKFLTSDGYSIAKLDKGDDGQYSIIGLKPGITKLQLTAKDGSYTQDIAIEVMATPVQVDIYDANGVKLN
jgi:uncharacterized protein YjdB